MTTFSPYRLVPFTRAHLPIVRLWFDDPETQRWLGGGDWPEMILDLQEAWVAGQSFRGAVVLRYLNHVLLDPDGRPVALVTGELYDRETRHAGDGPDGPCFVDAGPVHRPQAGLAVVVDPTRRRQGLGRVAIADWMALPHLEPAESFAVGIEPENVGSQALFLACGFLQLTQKPDWEGMLTFVRVCGKS